MASISKFDDMVAKRIEEEKSRICHEVATEYLQTYPDYSVSLEEFVGDLQANGVWDQAKKIPMSELITVVKKSIKGISTGTNSRMTKARKEELMGQIPAFLTDRPWSGLREIAAAMSIPAPRLRGLLKKLITEKKITQHGERAAKVFAVAGEKTKP